MRNVFVHSDRHHLHLGASHFLALRSPEASRVAGVAGLQCFDAIAHPAHTSEQHESPVALDVAGRSTPLKQDFRKQEVAEFVHSGGD